MDSTNIEFLQNLKQRLYKMMKSGDYSDVTFTIDGEDIYCHKNILASSCLYFDTMFKSGITGKDTNSIEIKTIPKDIFQAIVEFIYLGEIDLTEQNVQQFLEVADMMQHEDLKDRCCKFLMKEIDPSNCFGFLQLSCSLNTPSLKNDAFKYACENFTDAATTNDDLLQIDAKTIASLLTYPHINIHSEDFVIEKALAWMEYNPEERMETFFEVLKQMPLHTASPQFLQLNVVKNQHVAANPVMVTFLQDVINHTTFMSPSPLELTSSFPRTRTEYVEGIFMLSRQYITNKKQTETVTKIGYYRMEDEDCFTLNKSEDLTVDFENQSSLCSIDNTVYLSTRAQMLKYDIPTKQWTTCVERGTGSLHRIFLVEGKRLFSIEYSHYQCPVSEYIFQENAFVKRGRLTRKLTTNDFAVLEFQGKIYVFGGNEKTPDAIQVFDMKTNTSKLLDIKLPAVMTGLTGLVYKQKGIIMGTDATYIFDMLELDHISANQKHPSTPVTEDLPQPMETEASGLNEETYIPDLTVLTKVGIGRENYCLEKVGNQLIVMAGTSHHPKFCREVLVTNIDNMISDTYVGANFDSVWKTVGVLSEQLNRYNISRYKSVAFSFKQSKN